MDLVIGRILKDYLDLGIGSSTRARCGGSWRQLGDARQRWSQPPVRVSLTFHASSAARPTSWRDGRPERIGRPQSMCTARWRPDPELGAPVRAVVSDVPGEPIGLSLFGEDGRAAAAQLTPQRALALAGRLIEAAARRM